MTAGGRIDYDQLTRDAMRSIVRTVLSRTAKAGLPGEHHFYISFDTRAHGVILSKRLKEKYPEEMTIVLQHRFTDLIVGEDRFEVKLTFDNIPERLVVPFQAIKVFFDPSVHFGLQFDVMEAAGDGETTDIASTVPGSSGPRTGGAGSPRARITGAGRKGKASRKIGADRNDAAPGDHEITTTDDGADNAERNRTPRRATKSDTEAGESSADETAPVLPSPAPEGGAEIVRLDQFRKK